LGIWDYGISLFCGSDLVAGMKLIGISTVLPPLFFSASISVGY